MTEEEFKRRTKRYAIHILQLADSLPRTISNDVIARQLVKAGTSVAANYRSACRAKSRADFVNKLRIVEEEGDESVFWMEFLADAGKVRSAQVEDLLQEGNEIVAMVVSSITTALRKAPSRQSPDGNRQSAIANRQ